jgi:light-regulated signal transduction histidine kinase (bacteriophytochrome)
MRRLTGFDFTLVYQFDAGWNGIVVAEDGNGLLPSYLDLRFPESDIPAQARELYRRNRVRLIADNNYTPAPLMRAEEHRDTGHRPEPGGAAQRFARAPAVHAQHGHRRVDVGVAGA